MDADETDRRLAAVLPRDDASRWDDLRSGRVGPTLLQAGAEVARRYPGGWPRGAADELDAMAAELEAHDDEAHG